MSAAHAVPQPGSPTVLIIDTGVPGRRFQNLLVRVRPVAESPPQVRK
jgi:hypothetical protein